MLMLDMLVSKKTFEKVMDEDAVRVYSNSDPKSNMVESIIEMEEVSQEA